MTKRISEQAEPFVDQRTDGPGVSRIDPSDGSLPVGGGGLGSVALSMPLGLIFGRPGPPLSRAISSRCAATVRRNSAASSSSFSTKLFRSACDRPSRSVGGNIPRTNPTRALL